MEHPITPSPELIAKWLKEFYGPATHTTPAEACLVVATAAAQWGAEEEMHAICGWLDNGVAGHLIHPLLCARRPKPPSLKEQALEAAQRFYAKGHEGCTDEEVKDDFDAICRALEQLND